MFTTLWREWSRRWSQSSRHGRRTGARPRSCCPRVEVLEDRQLLSTFTVTNTSDDPANPAPGSLRWAIQQVNADSPTSGVIDGITFNIGSGPQTISLNAALPAITTTVQIFGITQPGYTDHPLITLNGENAGIGANGLELTTGNSLVVGLDITHFGGDGILLDRPLPILRPPGTPAPPFGNNTITDNVIVLNVGAGVHVLGSSSNTIAGGFSLLGPPSTQFQVLSGNGAGVLIESPDPLRPATGNVVERNYIGTDVTGMTAEPNVIGVHITNGASSNQIGGTGAGEYNLISGNATGVQIDGGAMANKVLGNNQIGDNALTGPLPNGTGVLISDASGNTILGATSALRNVILYNTTGVHITGAATGNLVQDNFVDNNGTGVLIDGTGTSQNSVLGNGILGNSIGVEINDASGNHIGGPTSTAGTGPGNQIANNSRVGVLIQGLTSAGAFADPSSESWTTFPTVDSGNFVQGNTIGFAGAPNGTGVVIQYGASGNTISDNVISGNNDLGVKIGEDLSTLTDDPNATTDGSNRHLPEVSNTVRDNSIGVDANGQPDPNGAHPTGAFGNFHGGVYVLATYDNTIGPGNVISGNNGNGVGIDWGSIPYHLLFNAGDTVVGNKIGTDAAGSAPVRNSGYGVSVTDMAFNTVSGNVISANGAGGILLAWDGGSQSQGQDNTIIGNRIGTDAGGNPALGNGGSGVDIRGPETGNTVGGQGGGDGNVIAGNGGYGVAFEGAASGSPILGNSIFANTRGGILPNAAAPRPPVITNVTRTATSVTVTGTGTSGALVEFFANDAPDAAGLYEGKTFLGRGTVPSGGTFMFTFNVPVAPGQFITATATTTDTSAFSKGFQVGAPAPVPPPPPALPQFSARVVRKQRKFLVLITDATGAVRFRRTFRVPVQVLRQDVEGDGVLDVVLQFRQNGKLRRLALSGLDLAPLPA